MAEKITTIQLKMETKKRLAQLGIKGETYDTIISRLLDKLKRKRKGALVTDLTE